MNNWNSFFSAIISASATLTGLIFVGVSIGLNKILAVPKLPSRALNALFLLVNILLISILCLVPNQSDVYLGFEILLISIICFIVTFLINIDVIKGIEATYKGLSVRNLLFTQVALLPFIIAGILTFGIGDTAFYWFIPGIILSIAKAVMDAWVLLIEIHR
jgi:hypothetical protein